MKRYICLDLGEKRTGIALVDNQAKVATPIGVIKTQDESIFIKELEDVLHEWEPVGIIIGLPIDLKGKEAISATKVRNRTDNIIKIINDKRIKQDNNILDIFFVDERMTTAQAEKTMINAGVNANKRKDLRDALAAVYIAQSFIDNL